MKERIELISDTVTRPSKEMLNAMIAAEVGDDVFRQDPTVIHLEEYVADLFGMEAALFCPSGTMTNQIALRLHTQPLDEVICDHYSHVYQYETGGYASNAGIAIQLIEGRYGKFTPEQLIGAIRPSYDWLPHSRLVVLENSCNKGGGSYYTLQEMTEIRQVCLDNDLRLHLDGARIFNVLVETGDSTRDIGAIFDTVSICLSKGLGAPVGSLLIGSKEAMARARRFRKVMGGGMRQAGYLAAACMHALENNIDRLKIDNNRAKEMGEFLAKLEWVKAVRPVQTNIVIFELANVDASDLVAYLEGNNISSSAFGPRSVRFVFHMDIVEDMIMRIEEALRQFTP